MWLSERTAARDPDRGECMVGVVTIGGARPSVLCGGEPRSTELLHGGALRLPRTGDELLVVRTGDGDCVALGRVGGTVTDGCENGEVLLTNGGGSVKIKNSGDITLTGTVKINGTLLINGQAYVPPASAATGA